MYKFVTLVVLVFTFVVQSSKLPSTINVYQKGLISKSLISSVYFLGLGAGSAVVLADDVVYVDKVNKFQVNQADGWTLMPRVSKISLSQYMHEEITLVGTNFVEGSSLSITKSRARQLLKDMKIDWWFDNLKSINDLGSANLIAELLILQRQVSSIHILFFVLCSIFILLSQGDFDKKQTPSEISSAIIDVSKNSLLFEYLTPLTNEVNRKTIVKAFYKPEEDTIICCWISGLAEIFKTESSYSNKLYEILNSYTIL